MAGHYVSLCSFRDEIVHDRSAISEKIINDKDLLGCFGSLLQSVITVSLSTILCILNDPDYVMTHCRHSDRQRLAGVLFIVFVFLHYFFSPINSFHMLMNWQKVGLLISMYGSLKLSCLSQHYPVSTPQLFMPFSVSCLLWVWFGVNFLFQI